MAVVYESGGAVVCADPAVAEEAKALYERVTADAKREAREAQEMIEDEWRRLEDTIRAEVAKRPPLRLPAVPPPAEAKAELEESPRAFVLAIADELAAHSKLLGANAQFSALEVLTFGLSRVKRQPTEGVAIAVGEALEAHAPAPHPVLSKRKPTYELPAGRSKVTALEWHQAVGFGSAGRMPAGPWFKLIRAEIAPALPEQV